VFSFHATKVASAGEGGAVTTDDADLAARLRLLRNFGFVHYDTVVGLGTNGKMSELAAAMGLTSLDSLDEFVAVNRHNHKQYARELDGVPGVSLLLYDEAESHNYHYVVLEVFSGDGSGPAAERWRDELVAVLHAENVLARRYFNPGCHRTAPYRDEARTRNAALPTTEDLSARVLVLPTGTAIGEADVKSICSIIRLAAENAAALHARLVVTELGV
jgi:dTDP-4-amino-4,6-dideoxygalactose transaminase